MTDLLLKNARVSARQGEQHGSVRIRAGRIAEPGDEELSGDRVIDLRDATLLPGFIDIHNHGAAGIDVNAADVDGLLAIGEFLARKGVTAWMPTLVPDTDENYRRVIGEIDRLMELQRDRPAAQAVGVHYEGVFANEAMCGALRPEYFKGYTGVEVDGLPRLKKGVLMTTLAPEVEGGIELIGELRRQGWVAAIGHSRADSATLDRAYEAGARHVTHLFNAMTGVHHRELGVAGWALTKQGVTFDIIPDGIHSALEMLELACRSKGSDGVCLISDSVAPTGLGDGEFELWGETIRVSGGRTQNLGGSIAGSVITMLDGCKQMRSLGFEDSEIEKMASRNPARLIGIEDTHGMIESGKRADLVALDHMGNVAFVAVGGLVV